MAHQSPPPSATSGHRSPPNSGDQSSASSSSVYFDSNPVFNPSPSRNPAIYNLSFNQDHTCFAVSLNNGFGIYNIDPFQLEFRPEIGGVEQATKLFPCNFLRLVGVDGNKVMIWGEDQSRFTRELPFQSEVNKVKLRQDRIVVVLIGKIYVYNVGDLKMVEEIDTCMNPKGLCEISQAPWPMVLACPHFQEGEIIVYDGSNEIGPILRAHDSAISCMAMTPDAKFLASACDKGTLIMIYNPLTGQLVRQIVRGYDRAEVYSLAFCTEAKWLAVSSDKGSVQVFSLETDSRLSASERSLSVTEPNDSNTLDISSLPICKEDVLAIPNYFSPEQSLLAQFRLPEGVQHFVVFGHQQKNTVVSIGMDGSFYRREFDPEVNGGEMTQRVHDNFLERDWTEDNVS